VQFACEVITELITLRADVIIFLQNPWSPAYAGTVWPRRSWLRALAASPTGRRLRLLTDDLECVHNASPLCAADSKTVHAPDEAHVRAILGSCAPDVVVACGQHAEDALRRLWAGPLLCLPHPTYRVLTNALYRRARRILAAGVTSRLALRQRRRGCRLEAV
jgi:hypothetical protein